MNLNTFNKYWTLNILRHADKEMVFRKCGLAIFAGMSEIDRRSLMKMAGFGLLVAAAPASVAHAERIGSGTLASAVPLGGAQGRPLFADEFEGPAGSLPDGAKWAVEPTAFLDGNSNLVIRTTREGDRYVGGSLLTNWQGGAGTAWEARVRLQALPDTSDSSRLAGWHGHIHWAGAELGAAASESYRMDVDDQWHTWRGQLHQGQMYVWSDYVKGARPSFEVPARSISNSRIVPVLSLTAPSSGAVYPAQMLVDSVRVW